VHDREFPRATQADGPASRTEEGLVVSIGDHFAADAARDAIDRLSDERDQALAERDKALATIERVRALTDEYGEVTPDVPCWAIRAALDHRTTTKETQ